jgi:Holliday junction resolvase
MVKKYAKGYRAERLLLQELSKLGYMVMRAPHSGSTSLASPDIIAVKGGRVLVIECKAREEAFKIEEEQMKQLCQWQGAGCVPYVAWKISRGGWKFIHLDRVMENGGKIGKKFADSMGVSINEI